jgi:hypothetical protein
MKMDTTWKWGCGIVAVLALLRTLPDLADDGGINGSSARREALNRSLDQTIARLRQARAIKERRLTRAQREERQRYHL